jgi:hypothetical protein
VIPFRLLNMSRRGLESPLVSVIVPVRDRFSLAERSLLSVYAQTYRPIELIVVDDASNPPFAPPPRASDLDFRLVRLDTNVGPGAARETGRRQARGDFIAYLDSDDYWRPMHLSSLAAALSLAPDAGMAYSAALEVCITEPPKLRAWSDVAHAAILSTLLWRRPWHTSACLWRRELTGAAGWLSLWHYEDYAHDCRAGCLGAKSTHVSEPTCYVQTDAPGRQSSSPDERRKAESYGLAALAMTRVIRGTGWYRDARIRDRIRAILLGVAARAAEQRLGGLSAKAVLESWHWRRSSARLAVASSVGLPLSLMSAGRTSARIFRWARSRSADDPPGEWDPATGEIASSLRELVEEQRSGRA